MKVFVTGATGFIGRNLIAELLAEGFEVRALVRKSAHGLPDAVETVTGDILDTESLKKSAAGCDVLYHLAALIDFSPPRLPELLKINRGGARSALDAARAAGVGRTVVVSSACTFGLSKKPSDIRDESSRPSAGEIKRNPYMESKLASEAEAASAVARGQDVVVVNPTTVYGRYDASLNSGSIIFTLKRSSVVPVPPGGGNVVDARDVAGGMILAARKGKSGRRYALGGENLLFGEIFSVITKVLGKKPLFIRAPRCAALPMSVAAGILGRLTDNRFLTSQLVGDLFRYKYYSSALAANELGWTRAYSFGDSVRDALDYYKRVGITGGKK
ncbi:MAG: NAD-dependent epimerase/dehydratase family protein [Endomicrobiia bacterium]|nr:NAD-dependent epimerase/dehydratase family protein [Endomicrobiia bacterium]